jgi:NADH:ubiquinone oxidoreductase subunit K
MTPGLPHYLIVSAALFSLGMLGVLTRRNAVNVLMGVELVLNSANINLVAFGRFGTGNLNGQLFAVFVIVIAAAEVAVALAIVLTLYRLRRTPNLDEADILKG